MTKKNGNGDHESEPGVEYIYLELADGKELACQVVAVFEMENNEYIALLPDGQEDVYLYSYGDDNGEPTVIRIEDDNEYERASAEFMRLLDGLK